MDQRITILEDNEKTRIQEIMSSDGTERIDVNNRKVIHPGFSMYSTKKSKDKDISSDIILKQIRDKKSSLVDRKSEITNESVQKDIANDNKSFEDVDNLFFDEEPTLMKPFLLSHPIFLLRTS